MYTDLGVVSFDSLWPTLVSNETTERLVPELVPDFVELERNEFHLRMGWNGTKRNDILGGKLVSFQARILQANPESNPHSISELCPFS